MSPAAETGDGARAGSAVARMTLGGQLQRHRETAGDVLDLLALCGVGDAGVVAGLLVPQGTPQQPGEKGRSQ